MQIGRCAFAILLLSRETRESRIAGLILSGDRVLVTGPGRSREFYITSRAAFKVAEIFVGSYKFYLPRYSRAAFIYTYEYSRGNITHTRNKKKKKKKKSS
ncbi:hypothetical protein PUN28_004848 [Cardiocondyla obscurior]|uniref:Uncharacterized protein n=1 Tax=Cardiocondyla obscurior TaxID=286306 RepID=A0AAW2GCU9_9HYME